MEPGSGPGFPEIYKPPPCGVATPSERNARSETAQVMACGDCTHLRRQPIRNSCSGRALMTKRSWSSWNKFHRRGRIEKAPRERWNSFRAFSFFEWVPEVDGWSAGERPHQQETFHEGIDGNGCRSRPAGGN